MKLKLIRSGGFMNKAVTTEEDLNSYPAFLQEHIAQAFHNTDYDSGDTNRGAQNYRDNFQYFAEYNGRRLPLDILENDSMLASLVAKMKERLHF